MNASVTKRRIFKNAKIVDVITGSVYQGWFSVVDGRFEYVEEGSLSDDDLVGEILDLSDQYVLPGLIDTHMHIESSLVTPRSFAAAAIACGTCAVLQDPHEMANVFGAEGVKFMVENANEQPLKIYTAIPSCVPPTRKHLETGNAVITAKEVAGLSTLKNVKALGEVMDYQSVLAENAEIIQILTTAKRVGLSIEGHCPTLKDRELSKYIAYGIRSDHTLTNPTKMHEQLRKGMYVMLQRKSLCAENVAFIMKLKDRSRILLVTDDTPPADLLEKGHLNHVVQLAISDGWDPVDAIASATIRPAMYLNLNDLGSVTPGKTANFFTVRELTNITPTQVFVEGQPFTSQMLVATKNTDKFLDSLSLRQLTDSDFRMVDCKDTVKLSVNIITVNQENSVTDLLRDNILFKDGYPDIDSKDLVQIAVFRRNERQPTGSIGLLGGLGLHRGAFATSFAHDSHNLLIIGKDPHSMARAANTVIQIGGGMVAVDGDRKALLELPIGGLISDQDLKDVAIKQRAIESLLRSLGMKHKSPLALLTVLSLTVSPYYKMSDFGIVDTEHSRIIPAVVRGER